MNQVGSESHVVNEIDMFISFDKTSYRRGYNIITNDMALNGFIIEQKNLTEKPVSESKLLYSVSKPELMSYHLNIQRSEPFLIEDIQRFLMHQDLLEDYKITYVYNGEFYEHTLNPVKVHILGDESIFLDSRSKKINQAKKRRMYKSESSEDFIIDWSNQSHDDSSMKLYFDMDTTSTEEIGELIAYLSELYKEMGGDYLQIKGSNLLVMKEELAHV